MKRKMKLSIRWKLLFYMLVSVFFFVVLLLLANTFLVERYYLERTKKELLQTSDEIGLLMEDSIYDDQEGQWQLKGELMEQLRRIERARGHAVVLRGSDDAIYYPLPLEGLATAVVTVTSDTSESDQPNQIVISEWTTDIQVSTEAGLLEEPLRFELNDGEHFFYAAPEQIIETTKDGSVFILEDDLDLKARTLRFHSKTDSGLSINVSTPMSVISDGIMISNQFSSIIGVITVIFTVIWSAVISHYFTKPIQEMSQVTSKMTELDFSERNKRSTRNDEISQLSENINVLSDKLAATIAELNLRNLELADEVERERAIDQMRRDFIANVSHELKTPIFLIQGYADGLKQNVIRSDEKKEFYCDVIAEEADKMNEIVKDLLTIAKSEASRPGIVKSQFVIEALIQDVLNKYTITFQERGIELRWNSPHHTVVYGDPRKIEQVLTNYINNAVEFTARGGQIRIEVETIEPQIRVSVYNTGEPIPPDKQKLIWDSFYKADESRNRQIGGAGLGLAIVRTLMAVHGNRYGVRNTADGVCFWFELDIDNQSK